VEYIEFELPLLHRIGKSKAYYFPKTEPKSRLKSWLAKLTKQNKT